MLTFPLMLADCKMVKAVCGCLNVKIHIKDQGELNTLPQFHTDSLEVEESRDEFFQQVSGFITLLASQCTCFIAILIGGLTFSPF